MSVTADGYRSPLSQFSQLTSFSDYDSLHEVREATDSPTPLSELLHDPVALKSLLAHKKRRGSASTASRDRSASSKETSKKEKEKDSETASILTLVLAEEERQAHHLKAVLRNTGERLEHEMRRADQAEKRAFTAESQLREMMSKMTRAEAGQHQAELDNVRMKEELTRYRVQFESMERDLRKMQNDVTRLERAKDDLERSLAEEREIARRAQQALREWQAREEGREEGRKLELIRRYNDGREDGYEDGRAEGYEAGHAEGYEEGHDNGYTDGRSEGYNAGRLAGFEEGKNIGWSEGFNEGIERGRKEEREAALRAFDKFVASEFEGKSVSSDDGEDRTHEWVESIRRTRPHSQGLERMAEHMAEYGRGRNHHHRSRSTSRSRSRPLPPAPARELPPTPDMVEQRPQYEYVNEPLETIAESPVSPRRREEYLAPSRDLPTASGSGRQSPMPPRATSPSVPVWLHRRLNSNGQTPRAMSPLPAVPAVR